MCLAQRLRGQGSEERMGGLLDQIWLPGRLMEGSPPAPRLVHRALWLASTSTHVGCKILGAPPPPGALQEGLLLCQRLLSFQRDRLCLVDIEASPHGPPHPLPHPSAPTPDSPLPPGASLPLPTSTRLRPRLHGRVPEEETVAGEGGIWSPRWESGVHTAWAA